MADGIVCVDKPQGWTSHQVVGRMRRLLGTRKVGHAGTLDPMATGLLIVGVNRATRLLGHLAGHDKTYLATIRLGQASSTDDAEGELSAITDASGLDDAEIEAAMVGLRGEIEQVPSTVSAIKVDGRRAYALARAGQDVTLKARRVEVSRFEVIARRVGGAAAGAEADPGPVAGSGPFCDLDVVVDASSGTYVRALARDLGAVLGVGGHLTMLRRTRIGSFVLPDRPLDLDSGEGLEVIGMGALARATFDCIDVDEADAIRLGHGQRMRAELAGQHAALGPDGDLVALVEPDAERGFARPTTVFRASA